MCGILACLWCSDDSAAKRARIIHLAQRLKHRGPDWIGVFQHEGNFLAHQRLAVVDLTSGDQPLFNEDNSIAVIANGEIYNHEDLRKQLPNHKFRTNSDCEVIAHLYEEYGENFVDMLDGIFSFVLLDTRTNNFLVARDAIGITSLYIGWAEDASCWVSSEYKTMHEDCEHYERFQPGTLYSSKDKGFRRWYNPPWFSEAIPSTPYDPMLLRTSLEKAVIKRLMTDVPFGVLLSGGLDSSLVASITARYLADTKAGKQLGTTIHSFCIGLEGSPDLKAGREVANYLGTVHHEFHFTPQDGIDAIEDVIYHIESYELTTVRSSIPTYLISRKIKSHGIKVVLSGEGSDEIFGGYLYFHKAPNKEEAHQEMCRKIKALHQYDCLRANKATSAWGLEARFPYLDKEFVNVVMNIDPDFKMSGHRRIEKWILRNAFDDKERPYLPQHILWRQKEQMSDGVGYNWIDALREHAAKHVTDKMMLNAARTYPLHTPATKEAYYYRMIFEKIFPKQPARQTIPWEPTVACCTPKALHWVPEWANNLDPSGRAAWGVHNAANKTLVTADVVDYTQSTKSSANEAAKNGLNGHH
ncbi:asparagine synthetase [glutamine-hydrolyzing] 2-like [Neltuma alba]|uniref:asparagine synthetase [glutamine-hydrolyzing] 2-like n=1 Tax=Neltuma alba TaxID=207710 RepID=UPI0010A3B551|nr:asparagine synthetase [glutamine-hydrolyzing] 2-like [Prosopis alba]